MIIGQKVRHEAQIVEASLVHSDRKDNENIFSNETIFVIQKYRWNVCCMAFSIDN